jgi:hypothetical protein
MSTWQEKTLGYKIKNYSLSRVREAWIEVCKLRNYKPKDMSTSWRIKTLGCGFDSIDQFYNTVDSSLCELPACLTQLIGSYCEPVACKEFLLPKYETCKCDALKECDCFPVRRHIQKRMESLEYILATTDPDYTVVAGEWFEHSGAILWTDEYLEGYFYSRTYRGTYDHQVLKEEFYVPGREPDTDAVQLLNRSSVDPFFMGFMARGKADLSVLVPQRSGREHSAFTLKTCAEFLESVEMHTCEGKQFLVLKFNF